MAIDAASPSDRHPRPVPIRRQPLDHRLPARSVYDNPWIAVREDQVIRPDGDPGIYGVVHFKNRAIGVLPVEDDGSIWLVGQHRYPLDALLLGDSRRGRPSWTNLPKRPREENSRKRRG